MEVKKNVSKIEKLKEAMMKKALGYDAEEVIEEFAPSGEEDAQVKLNKRKVTTKHYPPDLSAIKWILEYMDEPILKTYENMTKEELIEEKIKLLKMLEEERGDKTSKNRNKV